MVSLRGHRKATADLSTPLRSAQDDNLFVVVSKSPSTRLQRVFRVGEGLAPQAAEKGHDLIRGTERIPSGAKQAAEKGLNLILARSGVPQGLKPTFILRHLRHD